MKKAIIEIEVEDDYGTYGEDDCGGCSLLNVETEECELNNCEVVFKCPKLVD